MTTGNHRILVIDDNEAVHEDLRKILGADRRATEALDALETELFGAPAAAAPGADAFDVDSALQGAEGLERVRRALADGRPYAMAFVDVRMPPGWDGIETVARIWKEYPELQVVICTAYSDYTWEQTVAALGKSDRFVILRKPFDNIEVRQLASALTEKWALERFRAQRLEDLEGAVRARTHELEHANRRLVEEIGRRESMAAELRLKHKLEAIGRLAAGVAHEINNPTQWADLSLKYVRKHLPPLMAAARGGPPVADIDEEQREILDALDDMDEGLGRITRIVQSMKQLSHPGRGELAPVDLNQTLQAALTVCRGEYAQVAEVCAELGEVPPVLGNAADLGQAFVNLITNAADAIRETVATTRVLGRLAVRTYVDDGGAVVAAIQDSGGGIPATIRERIFEPFFTTKDVGHGTGQGLAIARSIVVDKHGGDLSFETADGQGTTFLVRLPATAAAREGAA
jgi:signal transduction histidine kinase